MVSLILGEYKAGELVYAGTVTVGMRFENIRLLKKGSCPFQSIGKASENIVWCRPGRVCTVEYMRNTLDVLRQPVFKGIRYDVKLEQSIWHKKAARLVRTA